MTALDERSGDLVTHIPNLLVLTDPEVTESYRYDRAGDPDAGRPLGWCGLGAPRTFRR